MAHSLTVQDYYSELNGELGMFVSEKRPNTGFGVDIASREEQMVGDRRIIIMVSKKRVMMFWSTEETIAITK